MIPCRAGDGPSPLSFVAGSYTFSQLLPPQCRKQRTISSHNLVPRGEHLRYGTHHHLTASLWGHDDVQVYPYMRACSYKCACWPIRPHHGRSYGPAGGLVRALIHSQNPTECGCRDRRPRVPHSKHLPWSPSTWGRQQQVDSPRLQSFSPGDCQIGEHGGWVFLPSPPTALGLGMRPREQ